mmetsp:Transcript_33131/g.67311  ORF Transcript_33131/g.67311 Transcript_33131/m.67311 type:complete len:83 (-) Transcript_33131:910-1158(-)
MTDGERRMRTELEGIKSKLEWEQQDKQDQVALLEQELQESNELRKRTSMALAELKATGRDGGGKAPSAEVAREGKNERGKNK